MEVSGQHQASAALTPGKNLGIQWVGPRVGLEVLEKTIVSCGYRVSITYRRADKSLARPGR